MIESFGGEGREREEVRRLDWRESEGRDTQDTYLAFPAAGVVVVGAVVRVGAREGGGRDVPEGFALLIDHGLPLWGGGRGAGREAGWAKGYGGGPGRRRRRTCW